MQNRGFVFDYRVVTSNSPPRYVRYRAVELDAAQNALWAVPVQEQIIA